MNLIEQSRPYVKGTTLGLFALTMLLQVAIAYSDHAKGSENTGDPHRVCLRSSATPSTIAYWVEEGIKPTLTVLNTFQPPFEPPFVLNPTVGDTDGCGTIVEIREHLSDIQRDCNAESVAKDLVLRGCSFKDDSVLVGGNSADLAPYNSLIPMKDITIHEFLHRFGQDHIPGNGTIMSAITTDHRYDVVVDGKIIAFALDRYFAKQSRQ